MVLEGIVVEVVNRFLGDYVQNLDKSQLSLSLWGGDVVLNNLFIKESLLDELELPVRVVHGNIGKLTLKIPWKNLYTEPTVAVLDGLYVIAVPRTSVQYNEEKEDKARWEAKKAELSRIEEAKKKEAEKDVAQNEKADSFTEKLVANIIKNLEITVTNIHVRFEDIASDPENPFSVGFTLHRLSLQTTDENWQLKVIKEAASVIFKMMELDSLSIYWNCGSEIFSVKEKAVVQSCLKETIADASRNVDHMYLIRPMISTAKLTINMKPEQSNFSMPKFFLDVVFQEICIALAKNQYQSLMEFIESLERLTLADKYRKYKPPQLPLSKRDKQWWQFAYTCILEEVIRRRKKMWSWTNILEHRKLCRRYRDLYKSKLQTNKPSQCERKLDIVNITMMRKQAELAAKKEGIIKGSGDAGGGWFSWLGFGGKQQKVEKEYKSVGDKLQEAMSADEKKALYDAIGYKESGEADCPKEYVAMKLHMMLNNLRLTLKDTTPEHPADVLNLNLAGIEAVINQRPSGNAVSVSSSLSSMSILGVAAAGCDVVPVLATSHDLIAGTLTTGAFIDFNFEINPIHEDCDTSIGITVQPAEVKYDAKTIIALVDFFKPPKDVYAIQLQAAAMAKLQAVKADTATGLLYAIEQQKFTKIFINVKPTFIILPEQGIYRQNCQMLVLDLGELNVETEKPPSQAALKLPGSQSLSLEEVKKQAYNKFSIRLKSVQLLMAHAGESWTDVRTANSSSLHLLRPMALNIDVFQCIIPGASLPKVRVIGALPTLSIGLSDQRLCSVLKLMSGIPLPESEPVVEEGEENATQVKGPDAGLLSVREEDELAQVIAVQNIKKNAGGEGVALLNSTTMELEFEIHEICVILSQHKKGNIDEPMLKVVVESLGVQLTTRDLDTSFSAYLGGIYIQYLLLKAVDNGPLINLINTPIMDGKTFKLLTIEVLMANKKHPEFLTTYQNTLQNIKMELSVLEVLLHQEALVSILALLQSIQKAVEKPPAPVIEPVPIRRSRRSSVTSSLSFAAKKIELRRRARKKVVVEIIDVALKAQLNSISVAVCNQECILSDVKIKNLAVLMTLQKTKTTIHASLEDVDIFHHLPNALYPKILSFEGGEVFKMAVIVHNGATEGSNYLDMRLVDTAVSLETGCMKIIFLNKFVQDLVRFADQFEIARERLSQAGSAMASQAAAAAQSMSSRSARLSLNIKLKAPVVIVPQNTRSENAIVIDLGQLNVINSFKITGAGQKSNDGLPPLLDQMNIELSRMKVSRALLLGTEMKAECQIIEPVTLSLTLTRNLAASWYHGHPDNELTGKLHNFTVLLSQGDLKTILSILNENLQEGKSAPKPTPSPSTPIISAIASTIPADVHLDTGLLRRETICKPTPTDIHSVVKLNVAIDSIKIELFNGDSDLSVGTSMHDAEQILARLQLKTIELLADVQSDTSMKATVTLLSCELQDARLGREAGITRMLVHTEAALTHNTLNMIDIGFSQDQNSNKDIDVKVNGLQIVICIEYLMQLKDFFMKGMPATDDLVTTTPTQPASENPARPVSMQLTSVIETKIQLAIIQPDIILVENPMSLDSNAVALSMHVEAMIRSSVVHQIVHASVKGLSVATCTYNPAKRESSKAQLLVPLDVELHSNAPSGKKHEVEVIFQHNVVVNISSASIRTVTATLASLSPQKDSGTDDELQKIPKDLWVVKKLHDVNFWFLQTGNYSGENVLVGELEEELQTVPDHEEQLILKKCRFIVKLLGGVGRRTVPFIITDMSLRNVGVRNWSSSLEVLSELTLEICYYNEQLAVWEPLIEPVESDMRHRPWELNIQMLQTDLLNWDEPDGADVSIYPPQMVINVISSDVLQLTVTKTAMEVFGNLSQSFSDAYHLVEVVVLPEESIAPYKLTNETGMFVSVKPGSSFQTVDNATDGQCSLDHGHSLSLTTKAFSSSQSNSSVAEVLDDQPKTITLIFEDLNVKRDITVNRAEKRAFSFEQRACPGEIWQVIVQTDMAYGCKITTLRSVVQVLNTLPYSVELYYKLSDDAMGRCGDVSPGNTTSILCEAVYTPPFEIYFKPSYGSYYESVSACKWKDAKSGMAELIECTASKADSATVFFMTYLTMEAVLFEATMEASAKSYLITLCPTIVINNSLPTSVSCKLEDVDSVLSIEAGAMISLSNAKPGHSVLRFNITYQSREWTGIFRVDAEPSNLNVMTFESSDNGKTLNLDLGVHCERKDSGTLQLSLYCPYWMINKTELDLRFKGSDDYIVQHPSDNKDIVFFLFKKSSGHKKKKRKKICKGCSCASGRSSDADESHVDKSFSTSRGLADEVFVAATAVRISLQIQDSDWSDTFSLDTVGSVGKVECKFGNQAIHVGVKIQLASNGLTKIVAFSPFFVVLNNAQFSIEIKELLPNAPWVEVRSGGCIPFWPVNPDIKKQIVARIKGTMLETLPFYITEAHTTLLQLFHDYGGINVECTPLEGSISIVFRHYCPGFATVLLINQTSSAIIEYYQKDMKERCLALNPADVAMFTWQNPSGARELVWSHHGMERHNELVKEGFECFHSAEEGCSELYWISFLDGMQRVLLFTEDLATVLVAQQAGELERVDKEINIKLQGVGLSLVNNQQCKEIAYMAITSSGVIWEKEKKKKFKALKTKQGLVLEDGYQRYVSELLEDVEKTKGNGRTALNRQIEVNFETWEMFKPHKARIRRSLHDGISLCYRISLHQTQLHIKINRLQLDNQIPGAVFPVVLAPIPPPKTVAAGSAHKPFAELSVLIRKSDYSSVLQIKYCKLLLQEFAVKVDQGFLGAMLSMFTSGKVGDDSQLIEFHRDCELAQQSLMVDLIETTSAGAPHFFDNLHCSPIKVHLSFSLAGADNTGSGDKAPQIQWRFLNLFLQSVGIVLTDVQDVVFKLGYFERLHTFYNQTQLTSEITRHYTQQALKQMYVLVLGLDVLGNPFGVIRGLAEGIEDLFYEPYQGAIQGPEEFAEGLALGVKSMLGHAVGGAASAVSRITGALGKGIATLTMDEDFQRKRREAINKRPADLKEGFAVGGKSLVMGVYHGFTGIVTKPVEGARQEGVKGFFKGAGKGLVGVITRPASGVVDFASSSFDGIRRFTELSDEVTRLRPQRFFQPDGIVRAYCYREAEGNQILQDAGKKKFASELYIGHIVTSRDCRHILLITEKRVIYIGKGDVFGQWDCIWDYTWAQLREAPQLTPRGIQILLKERQKKLIGSGSIGKMVTVQEKDRKYTELLVGKMRLAMSTVAS